MCSDNRQLKGYIVDPDKNGQTKLVTRPIPTPKTNDVLIEVAAFGINRPDIFQLNGNYAPPEGASDILGLELSGTVIETGENVTGLKVGDKVCALVPGGAYATHATVHYKHCLPVPKTITLEQAAGLPETFFTVWFNLFDQGNYKDQGVLVHGGSSGIGSAAIQMIKAVGGRIAVTAGTDEKCQWCRDLGADIAINYKEDDFEEALKSQSFEPAYVIDMVGGDYVNKNLRLLTEHGRHISIASLGGATAEIEIWRIMRKRLILTGSTLRPRSNETKARLAEGLKEKIWPLIDNGAIKTTVTKEFSFSEIAQAHSWIDKPKTFGKAIVFV